MQTQDTFNDHFDPAELRQLMQAVPAETEQLMRATLSGVVAELDTGKVPSWYPGSLRERRLDLADTLVTIGHHFDEARRQPGFPRYCPFAELPKTFATPLRDSRTRERVPPSQ